MPEDLCGFDGGRGERPLSRAISSFRIWFSTRSAWFSLRRASTSTLSIKSKGSRNIRSVNHETDLSGKPPRPEICPGYKKEDLCGRVAREGVADSLLDVPNQVSIVAEDAAEKAFEGRAR